MSNEARQLSYLIYLSGGHQIALDMLAGGGGGKISLSWPRLFGSSLQTDYPPHLCVYLHNEAERKYKSTGVPWPWHLKDEVGFWLAEIVLIFDWMEDVYICWCTWSVFSSIHPCIHPTSGDPMGGTLCSSCCLMGYGWGCRMKDTGLQAHNLPVLPGTQLTCLTWHTTYLSYLAHNLPVLSVSPGTQLTCLICLTCLTWHTNYMSHTTYPSYLSHLSYLSPTIYLSQDY